MLTENEYAIIEHTLTRTANKAYCSNQKEVQSLIDKGFMKFHCKLNYAPDSYFIVTDSGKEAYYKELDRKFDEILRKNNG